MGVPVTNSTLRELIPRSASGRLDESSPLSASDLITLLENIRARSESIKAKVQKTVTNYNTEFLRIITQSNQTVVNVENVAEQLNNVLELLGDKKGVVVNQGSRSISPHGTSSPTKIGAYEKPSAEDDHEVGGVSNNWTPVDVALCNLAAEVKRLRTKVKEREETLVIVETISSLHGLILATEKKFVPGELVEAAKGMVLLQEKLGLQDGNLEQVTRVHHHDVKVFNLLQDAWSDRYSKLLGLLEDLVSKAIVLDGRRSELSVMQHISTDMVEFGAEAGTVDLSSVFTAMDVGVVVPCTVFCQRVLGILDVRLAKFGDAIVRHILSPILKNSQTLISTMVLASGAASTPRSVLKWTVGHQIAEAVPEILYPKIVQVVKFLNNHVLGTQEGRMARFGRLVWPRLAEAIIVGCLAKAVPNETSQLKDFEHIADLTAKFEKELADEGLIANFDLARGDKLSIFASDVEIHFAVKKKKHVLAKARDLLMQSDYSLPKSTWMSFKDEEFNKGQDRSIYLLPDPCAVSLLARSLLAIVHEVLEDACLSTPRTALELYHASRDVMLLYQAIIPLKLGATSDKMQVAALCYNDCLYIAHDLLTFVYQYHEELPPSLTSQFTFVDLVPLFRRMAEEVLDQQINIVRSEVMQGLDRANGFQYTDEEKQFQLAQQSLEEVFDTFANVSVNLRPVLAHNVYKKVIGGLINMAVGRIIYDIYAINDIGVQETAQLRKILLIVQERVPRFLAPAVVDVSVKEQVEEEEVINLVSMWQKLKTLTDILDMSLASINQAWENGELSTAGFSPSELLKYCHPLTKFLAVIRDQQLQQKLAE